MSIPNEDWFQGRVALVTGASSGMGLAIAAALGEAGAKVGIHYRSNAQAAQQLAQSIRSMEGQALSVQGDLSRADEVENVFTRIARTFGPRIDMLVNAAGEWMDKQPILSCPEEQWNHMFAVNANSVFLCCQQAARRMIHQGEGAIVNIGSLAGHTGGGGGTVPYAAAKAAVHTFTRGLARELAPHGIRVNAVAPGMIETPMLAGRVSAQAHQKLIEATPLGRFGQPAEITPIVLALLSPAASYITGEIIEVNGGLFMH